MNFGLGIYDVFSRIVPGAFYLFILVQSAAVLGWAKVDWSGIADIKLLPSLGLLLIAYILGIGLDRLGSAWHHIFKKRGMSERVLLEFKKQHAPYWAFEFDDRDWAVLRSYIRIRNPDVADEIDRHNAQCIMLRNLSLGLFLLAIVESIHSIQIKSWQVAILGVFLVVLSYLLGIQARTLRRWFYDGIFETILAYRLNLEERVKPVKHSVRAKNAK